MRLKLYSVFILFFVIFSHSNAQVADCENLVFNTIELMPFEFNERCKTESYPFLSKNGLNLYYTNNQTYDWIFYSHRETILNKWAVPVPIEIDNFKSPIRSATLSEDEQNLYFISENKMYVSRRKESMFHFGFPEEIELKTNSELPLSYISLYPGEQKMIAYVNTKEQQASMVQFTRTGDRSFVFDKVISATKKEMGMLSENGLLYYFTNDDFPNVLFCRKRVDVKNDFLPEIYKVKTFEKHLTVNQLRISEKTGTVVLVLSDAVWNRNDIYFTEMAFNDSAYNRYEVFDVVGYKSVSGNINSKETLIKDIRVADPVKSRQIINTKGAESCKIEMGQTFPNPAKNTFYFYYSVTSENENDHEMPIFKISDPAGRVVYTEKLDALKGEAKITLEDVQAGSYLIRVEYGGVISEMIRITLN